jgi:hypothetical protein
VSKASIGNLVTLAPSGEEMNLALQKQLCDLGYDASEIVKLREDETAYGAEEIAYERAKEEDSEDRSKKSEKGKERPRTKADRNCESISSLTYPRDLSSLHNTLDPAPSWAYTSAGQWCLCP